MKILVNDFSGHPFQIQLSRQLAKRGHTVLHTYCASFLTPHGALNSQKRDSDRLHIQAIQLDAPFEKHALWKRWRQERKIGRALVEAAAKFKPDIIISANMPLGAQGVLLRYARKHGISFVFWIQDLYSIGIVAALKALLPVVGAPIGMAFRWYERRLLTASSHVVAISEDFICFLPVAASNRTTVIENWAPLEDLPVLPRSNAWSRAQGLDDKLCFLYSGTLGMKHNPALLLELARQFKSRDSVQIVVISEGPGAEYLIREAAAQGLRNLTVMGFQPFELMPQILASADILVAILEKEAGVFAVPSKVLTYLCARRPLLLAVPSDNLAARIVNDNQAGLVIPPDDLPAFVTAAQHLAGDKGLRDSLAEHGRAYAERKFEIERITDQFESLLQAASAKHLRGV